MNNMRKQIAVNLLNSLAYQADSGYGDIRWSYREEWDFQVEWDSKVRRLLFSHIPFLIKVNMLDAYRRQVREEIFNDYLKKRSAMLGVITNMGL
jgi:hypothetical protein